MRVVRVFFVLGVVLSAGSPAFGMQRPPDGASPQPTSQVPDDRSGSNGDLAGVLYSQMTHVGSVATSSQNFSPSQWDAFDDQLADDFIVPAGVIWRVTLVHVEGIYTNPVPGSSAGPASSVNVFIYYDASGIPGALVAKELRDIPDSGLKSGNFDITLASPIKLGSGTYWVSVQTNEDYEKNGQWKWVDRTIQSNSEAAWTNPGDGFGTGCTTWMPRGSTCLLDPSEPDQIFKLIGTEKSVSPHIFGFDPAEGPVGTPVTVTGTGFTGATTVAFNGTNATFTVDSDTQISTTVPSGATTGKITVTTPGGTATSRAKFKVTPVITGFDPPNGPVGSAVTLDGSGFVGTTLVQFRHVVAQFDVVNDGKLVVTVPPGAIDGPIKVTTTGGSASTKPKSFVVTPGVSSFSPSQGPPGTVVTVTGTTFTGATLVTFNGTSAGFTVDSDTQITATVPVGATTGKITVITLRGAGSSAQDFVVTP